MEKKKSLDIFQILLIIILILFGLFIAFQLIKKIFIGSWSTENIIVALLVFTIGLIFTISINLMKLNLKQDYLEKKVNYLAKDFKEHLSNKY